MAKIKLPFMLSVEDTPLHSFSGDFHLGTDPVVALDEVKTCWHGRANAGMPVVTTALKDNAGRLLAVYDGAEWRTVAPEMRQYV